MWKLREIYAQNICAFRELHYTLTQGVTTLIFGDNRDNESQRSNGSGKSALLECVALGITGSTLRKIKNEEIINDQAEECFIELVFVNDCSTEEFIVERQLFRKDSSVVKCSIVRDGVLVTTDEAVQPTVDAYNRYVLEKLGITRDELYNNFVLSKHKYQDFLSCSDKDKKDIINRFSNGVLVDKAIEEIQGDKIPIEKKVRQFELELAGVDGKISVLQEQISNEEEKKDDKIKSRQERIASINKNISEKRSIIRSQRNQEVLLEQNKEKLKRADEELQKLENEEMTFEKCLSSIRSIIIPLGLEDKFTNWKSVIKSKNKALSDTQNKLESSNISLANAEQRLSVSNKKHELFIPEFEVFTSEYEQHDSIIGKEIENLTIRSREVQGNLDTLKSDSRQLNNIINNLKNMLAGTINCPACGYGFIVANRDFDVEIAKLELERCEGKFNDVSNQIGKKNDLLTDCERKYSLTKDKRRALIQELDQWHHNKNSIEQEVKLAEHALMMCKSEQEQVYAQIQLIQSDIDNLHRRLFDEVFELVDNQFKSIQRQLSDIADNINGSNASIESLEGMIAELQNTSVDDVTENLRKSLKEYRTKSSEIIDNKTIVEIELRKLEEQEENFVMFKTYLANTKIEALSKITNEFLENIGSDIHIKFSGYTVLKSGKVREKISISLIRSGMDCGSFGKFSAGEAARVNLATILAMQKLINSNCEGDKGLDLLVLDEILEAVDEDGLAHMFHALNGIGITALIVSHGNIAESYPHKILVVKENGESKINE